MSWPNLLLCGSNLLCGGLFIGLAIPLIRRRVKMNHNYGFRYREAFVSEENWYEINAHCGRLMIPWGAALVVVGAVALFMPLDHSYLVHAFAFAPCVVLVPCVQGKVFARRLVELNSCPDL
ncbi:MAG: SdpI family protein [Gemmatimonadetes bacterium]|jgi:hypothetical protein|nr:SdpI family protein [Gemmatimonadota bacterium]MBT6150285.1 SdpI family protein [Gemmatimonadota bacterium]MBT7862752.1 SdpI family protein [Gemmatimonadota bacterium]